MKCPIRPRAPESTGTPARSVLTDGFTLLEVLLALAIVSSMLTAALGLIPLGLRAVGDAERTAAEARILHDLQQHCFSNGAIPEGPLFFSRNGSPLLSGKSNECVFTVILRPIPGTNITTPGNADRVLRTVLVEMRDQTPSWHRNQTLVLPPMPLP